MGEVTFDGKTVMPIEIISRPGRGQYPGMTTVAASSAKGYLECKRKAETENSKLWRIHEKMYDLEDYMDDHPGGRSWMEMTRGTDCTEAYECHHLDGEKVNKVLKGYYVRDVKKGEFDYGDRFTYEDKDFWRSLRRDVLTFLRQKGPKGASTMELTRATSSMMVATHIIIAQFLIIHTWAAVSGSFALAALAGVLSVGCWGVGHNFLHQSDKKAGWYRLVMDLGGPSATDFRLTHALSHHVMPNLPSDFEACWYVSDGKFGYTNEANMMRAWPILAVFSGVKFLVDKTVSAVTSPKDSQTFWRVIGALITWTQLFAYIAWNGVWRGLGLFALQLAVFGLCITPVGLAAHNATLEAQEAAELKRLTRQWREFQRGGMEDFGAHQLISSADHSLMPRWVPDVVVNYLSLCGFGFLNDHTLHHLFPAVDHSHFRKLHETFEGTVRRHKLPYKANSLVEMLTGFNRYMLGRKVILKNA